jgi:hypothetical protein
VLVKDLHGGRARHHSIKAMSDLCLLHQSALEHKKRCAFLSSDFCFLNWAGVELGPLHTSLHWFQSMAGVRSLVLEASILHFCSVFVLLVGPLPFLYKKYVIELSTCNTLIFTGK